MRFIPALTKLPSERPDGVGKWLGAEEGGLFEDASRSDIVLIGPDPVPP